MVWNKLYRRSIYENLRFPVGKINEDEFIDKVVAAITITRKK